MTNYEKPNYDNIEDHIFSGENYRSKAIHIL